MKRFFTRLIYLTILLTGLGWISGNAQVTNLNTALVYGSIQEANDAAATMNGHTLAVAAGTYTGAVITKELQIQGTGGGTIVVPNAADVGFGTPGSLPGGHSTVFLVQANNVTITTLTVDGNNAALVSGTVIGGQDIDARNGIITDWTTGEWTNLNVNNVTVRNVYLRGIMSSYSVVPGSVTYNFNNNTLQNIQGNATESIGIMGWGGSGGVSTNTFTTVNNAIVTMESFGTNISGNNITNVAGGSGITSNQNGTGGGVADVIDNNTIAGGAQGIQLVVPYRNVNVHHNTVTGYTTVGFTMDGGDAAAIPTIHDNNFDGMGVGVTGVRFANFVAGPPPGNFPVFATVMNNYIRNNTGEGVLLDPAVAAMTVTATFNYIDNPTLNVRATGPGAVANMTCNYWGTTDPAAVTAKIQPNGSVITFIPYLPNGTDSDPGQVGFQSAEVCTGVCVGPTSVASGESFTCAGGTGTITLTGVGAGPFTVTLEGPGGAISTVTTAAGPVVATVPVPIVAGVYTFTVTQVTDATGCTTTVTAGSGGTATITVGTGAFLAPPTQTLCNGQTSSITVTFFGTPPFNYDYRIVGPTAGQFTDVINASSATYTTTIPVPPAGTTAGTFTYTVTQVRDANGCVGTGQNTATVIVNPVPNATFTPTTQTICQGSTATVTINFIGQAPFTFTYTVHNGSTYTVTIAQVSPTNTFTLTLQPPGAVQPGTYTYTIDALMDGNGCTGTVTNTANIIVAPLPTAVISGTSTVCAGDQAQASFTVTGAGTITVSYINNLGQTGTVTGTAGTFTGTLFTPGNGGPGALGLTYTITSVQDANGCVGTNTSGTATVTVNPLPTAVIAGVTSTCTGSMATLTFTVTGTGPITVTYNNSAGQVSSTSFPAAGSYSQTVVTPVPPGAYTYTITSVTDATGCTGTVTTGTGVVTVHPLPTAVYRAGTASQTVCAGTFTPVYIDLTGVAPNTYSLTYAVNGNPTTVAVVGNTYTITAPPAPGSAGTYTYTIVGVQDLTSGCSNTSTSTATVTVKPLPTAVIGGTTSVCTGGTASLNFTVTGAGPVTVTYTYSPGGGTYSQVFNPATGAPVSRPVVTPVAPGTYTYTIISAVDANGCVATATSGTGTVTVNPLPTATYLTPSQIICYGSTTSISISLTGTPPFILTLREDGPTAGVASGTFVINAPDVILGLVPTTPTIAGVYTYTIVNVTDANGCSNAATSTATITVLPQFTVTSTVVPNPVCNPGTTTATITPSSIPGTPPLVGTVTYTLTGPVSGVMTATGLNPVSFPGLTGAPQPGGAVYTVTAVNANGCVATHTFTVIQNPPISGNIIGAVNPTCPGASDGSYHIPNISGGYPPYQVSSNGGVTYKPWPGPGTTSFTGLPAGIYVTFVRDALGCVMPIGTVTLQDPTPVTLGQPVVTDQTCATAGTITIRAQGGTGSYTYTLTAPGGATTQQTGGTNSVTFNNLTGGTYTVTVQDSNNCPAGGVSRVVTVAGGTPDLLLTSSINPPIASFPALGSQVSITYTISSKNGIASNAIIVRVTKPFSGYTMVLAPGQPNSWTDVTPGGVTLFKEYQLNGAVPCAGSVQLVVVITRSGIDSPSTGVPITAAVRNAVNPDPNDFDNARASQFRVQ